MFAFLLIIITPCLSSIIIENKDMSNFCIDPYNPIVTDFNMCWLITCCQTCDNQNWIFEEHPDLEGYYKIINIDSGRAIDESRGVSTLETTINDDNDDSKYWELIFDNEENPTSFRMFNLAHPNDCIDAFSNHPDHPGICFANGGCLFTDTSNWKFTDDYAIINVDFNLNEGLILSDTPFVVGSGICNNANGGSSPQQIKVIVSETRTETSSFEHSHGFEIKVGTEFETGIPFVAETKISTEISTSHDFVFGEETSVEKQFAVEQLVVCNPGEIISVDCIVFTAEIDVPYTMTVLGINSGIKFESNGIYEGVTSYELACDFTHLNPSDNKILFTERQILTIN